jgi:hypothetical protein
MSSARQDADFRSMRRSRTSRAALAASLVLTAAAAAAAPAQAGVLTKSATNCEAATLTQPFKPWLDSSYYKPVAGGSFETGTAGWTLTGGARVVDGNTTRRDGSRSLLLPAGASATTPPVCVGLDEPTLRYFGKAGSLLSTLTVSVQVQLELGLWITLPIGVDLGTSWQPSLPHLVVANLLPLFPPDMTAVRFTFKPLLGSFAIDDVFVDPRMRH